LVAWKGQWRSKTSDWQSIMHHNFILEGATVNKETLAYLWKEIHLNHPEMWAAQVGAPA
jgi:hypothetical protein